MKPSNLVRIALAAAAAGAVAAALAVHERDRAPRTIALSMNGYAFNGVNPTLTCRAGERVRFVLTNDEETMVRHDFQIAGTTARCQGDLLPGQRREVVVTISRAGVYAYSCCTHRGMGGKLVVSP